MARWFNALDCSKEERMSSHYRALISVPVAAEDDDEAYEKAVEYEHSLLHPGGDAVAGHLELLGEVAEGSLQIQRIVLEDPGLRRQLPTP
jgi:hypothetical protein